SFKPIEAALSHLRYSKQENSASHTNVIAIPSLSSFIITPLTTNAALSGEQRQPPNLTHCTLNT
ncbi:hypothetical protein NB582_23865, partial [Vibrio parahaemolyticus]|nr:hypothetical protein [Vibrio parahaemolyticus]